MSINFEEGIVVKNESNIDTGATAKHYRTSEFHYYPDLAKASVRLFGYKDESHFITNGKDSWSCKYEFSWDASKGDTVPTTKVEAENDIITKDYWTDGVVS